MSGQRFAEYGCLAEFADEHDLLDAIHRAHAEGYTVMEAYTPLPIEEVSHALGYKNHLPAVVLAGGVIGALGGFGMQYYVSVIDYPLNVGGRPPNSWPAFIVVTFEMTILCAALAAVLGMLALNGLPQPYHPVFNVPSFELASRNRFFLMILSRDPRFDSVRTRELLESVKSLQVAEVPR
jgi:ActD protein